MRGIAAALVFIVLLASRDANAQARIEKNVVYGMYSGLALLMDVHHPEKPNGYGVVFVSGSGWQAPLDYGASGLKEQQVSLWGPPLLRAGYTVFAINHRAAPRFQDDVQRAVRFIRHHAGQFGVNPARLGGVGGSSGAHLIGLVAMLGAAGIAEDADPVNREPATLQTVVLRAAPTDLRSAAKSRPGAPGAIASFIEGLPNPDDVYKAASPIEHVSLTSPPVVLLHGESDDTVPYEQSVAMEKALQGMNVPVKLIRIVGGEHGPNFGTAGKPHPQLPQLLEETVAWLDTHLKAGPASK